MDKFKLFYVKSYDDLPSNPDHVIVSPLGIHCIFYNLKEEYVIQSSEYHNRNNNNNVMNVNK